MTISRLILLFFLTKDFMSPRLSAEMQLADRKSLVSANPIIHIYSPSISADSYRDAAQLPKVASLALQWAGPGSYVKFSIFCCANGVPLRLCILDAY